jgi:hypothetical protein
MISSIRRVFLCCSPFFLDRHVQARKLERRQLRLEGYSEREIRELTQLPGDRASLSRARGTVYPSIHPSIDD